MERSLVAATGRADVGSPQPVSDEGGLKWKELTRVLARRQRILIVVAGGVALLNGVWTLGQRVVAPVYQGSFQLLIRDPISATTGDQTSPRQTGTSDFQSLALNQTRNNIPDLIAVMRSPLVLSDLAKRFDLSAGALARRISIAPVGGGRGGYTAGIIRVSLTGRNPKQDEVLIKALANTYLEAAQDQRQQRLRDGLAFLNQQAPALEASATEVLNELEAFRQKNLVLSAQTEAKSIETALADKQQSLTSLENNRRDLLRVRSQVATGKLSTSGFVGAISSGGSPSGSAVGSASNTGLSGSLNITGIDPGLVEQLTKVEAALAEARGIYKSSSSVIRGLELQKNKLRPVLLKSQLQAIDTALQVNADQISSTQFELDRLEKEFKKQPALIKTYDALNARLQLAQQNLRSLTSAQESFRIELAQNSVPWRLMVPPRINPVPIKPSVPRGLAFGLGFGVVCGVAAALVRDRLDHVFHHAGEVKEELDTPLLAHIPHVEFFKGVREDKRFLLQELDSNHLSNSDRDAEESNKKTRYQRFFYQEAFRNLFTSLRFLNSDHPLRAITMTSSLPAEGKSLVNVLLAKTLSEMGKRVLLIDADLRKPQMHHRLGLNNLSGLSNLLADEQHDWREVMQTVKGYENWSVITAGRTPPDPTRLLSSERMNALVKELSTSDNFDLVIFDTPPILGLADAALVAEHCDGLMLLISLRRVDRSLPKEAIERIRSSGAPLLGVVTNAVQEEQHSGIHGYGKYGYGYGYGNYGYGGYGYAAYNTAATYSHYAEPDDEPVSPTKSIRLWRQKLKTFLRWLDS